MNNRLNKFKYPGAKRLMLEAQELKDKTEDYCAQPIDDNLFEWHFTVRGPPDTAFEGGYYHGRLSFPTEYPMKPPSIILLTPNGRFSVNKKICLSISGYHPETWQPSWSVRTALLALMAFMPTKSNSAIGSLDFSDAERKKLAEKSRAWRCETCGLIKDLLRHPEETIDQNESLSVGASTSKDDSRQSSVEPARSSFRTAVEEKEGDKYEDSQKLSRPNQDLSSNASKTCSPKSHSSTKTENSQIDKHSQRENTDLEPENDNGSIYLPADRRTQNADQSNAPVIQDNRRSYPILVYASIFLLLILLVTRRVAMLIQS